MKTATVVLAVLLMIAGCSSSGSDESDSGELRQTAEFAVPAAGGRMFFGTNLRFTVDSPDCGETPIRVQGAVIEILNSDGERFEGSPGVRPLMFPDLVEVDGVCAAEIVAAGFVDQLTNRMDVVINSESFPISIEEFLAGEATEREMIHVIERSE